MSQFFWITTCVPVMINFKLGFYRYIVRCCRRPIFPSSTKIFIHSHRVCYFYIPESLSNSILNAYNIIRSEYGFKLTLFPHIYWNIKYINIRFTNKFRVENIFFNCTFVISYLFWIDNISISVHKINSIEKYVSI